MSLSDDKVHLSITIPREVYDELKKERVMISPLISKLLTERYLASGGSNKPVMVERPVDSRPMSLKELVSLTMSECDVDKDNARLMGGYKAYEIDKVYNSLKTRTATTRDAVYQIMMKLIE